MCSIPRAALEASLYNLMHCDPSLRSAWLAPLWLAPVSLHHASFVNSQLSTIVDPLDPPTILLVHGALGDAEQMRPLADALGELGSVHLVELPGHGRTPLPSDATFGLNLFARTIGDAALQHRVGDRAPLCFGYSMGGYAALTLAATSPDILAGIVTLGTKFEWTPDVAAAGAARLDAALLQAKVPAFAEQLRQRHEDAGGWELLLSRTAAFLTGLGADPILQADTLANIRTPVRLVVGSRDDTVTSPEVERMLSLLPNATMHVLADMPHAIERVAIPLLVDIMRDIPRS